MICHLHGYASSPKSSKAAYFRQQFAAQGIELHIPDLNVPSFEYLTLTAMIQKMTNLITPLDEPVYLIGSSMGGGVALNLLHLEQVKKAVLLAPAIDFMDNRQKQLGEAGLQQWRETGWLEVQHLGYKETRRVHYGLLEDLQKYDNFAVPIDIPVLIIQGIYDEALDYRHAIRLAEQHPDTIQLDLIQSDHGLLNDLPMIWEKIDNFLKG